MDEMKVIPVELPVILPSRWVAVNEELPKNEEMVLLWEDICGYVDIGYYCWECNCFYIGEKPVNTLSEITHWMPLPEPPEARSK